MKKEQENKGSTDVEPKVITEGRSSKTEREVPEVSSTMDLVDDDR